MLSTETWLSLPEIGQRLKKRKESQQQVPVSSPTQELGEATHRPVTPAFGWEGNIGAF